MPNELQSELHNAVGQARGILEDLQRLGLGEVYSHPVESVDELCGPDTSLQSIDDTLIKIESDLDNCQRCSLASGRSNLVFGAGNPNAELVFIGEGPGEEEDRRGAPFAGESGQLLDRIMNAMGMVRNDVYLCNIVKCLPPNRRYPDPNEIAACEPFLIRQLESIRPKVIVTLGQFATQSILKSDAPISKLRGKWQQYQGISVMPTFHPAYLLQNPLAKREVWTDMKGVLKRLNGDREDIC